MAIIDICTKSVVFCEKGSTLRQAAQLMKKHNVGTLLATEFIGSKKTIGIVTDRDVVLGIAADNHSLTTQVTDIMSNDIISVQTTAGIADVIEIMEKECKRRVIVIDKSDHVVGIVSTDDIMQLLAREMKSLGNLFQKQQQKPKSVKLLRDSFLT
jgi:predicted transcriptional regulator